MMACVGIMKEKFHCHGSQHPYITSILIRYMMVIRLDCNVRLALLNTAEIIWVTLRLFCHKIQYMT